MNESSYDWIIIGGGASGLFAAVNAAKSGAKVLVLEKTNKLLAKVKISGGGRCNVTHACFEVPKLVQFYPRGHQELKPVFKQFNPKHTIEWFENRGVKLKTEADGRMFPVSNQSQTIIDCLLKEANTYNVNIKTNCLIESIESTSSGFEINYIGGSCSGKKLLLATGGNLKGVLRDYLLKTGHTFVEEVPSLFTFNIPNHTILALSGVAVESAKVSIVGSAFNSTGPLLITHWGLSGPAVLRLSAWAAREIHQWHNHFNITVNWLPHFDEQQFRSWFQSFRSEFGSKRVSSKNPFELPNRLWDYLLQQLNLPENLNWADLNKEQLKQLIRVLLNHPFEIKGKTTYKEEFVTCGGISLDVVQLKTMSSKLVPNLYFAGEVLNIDGITGGFNFQFAWSSGWIAVQ